jgi:hypothetical protein
MSEEMILFEVPIDVDGTTMYLHVKGDRSQDSISEDYYSFEVLHDTTINNIKSRRHLTKIMENTVLKAKINEAIEDARQRQLQKNLMSKTDTDNLQLVSIVKIDGKRLPYLHIYLRTDTDSLLKMVDHFRGVNIRNLNDFIVLKNRKDKKLESPPDLADLQCLLNMGIQLSELLEHILGYEELEKRLQDKAGD